jgi:Na+-translocating ferredoxin:NAD+ oxidoreductase RNF subunit RnfB
VSAVPEYFHSVTLERDKCKGCTNCIKGCPTEAIRVRDGKAVIIEERCIDCGECIRVCPNRAKAALTEELKDIARFHHPVALIPPSFYGQFPSQVSPGTIAAALQALGFHRVLEVGLAAEYVTEAVAEYLEEHPAPRPLISSACPAVVRLIQVRFPSLADLIIRVEAPIEVAAAIARQRGKGDMGVFFISPCPAKVTSIKQPVGRAESGLDGALSMAEVYGQILPLLREVEPLSGYPQASHVGTSWGRSGGEREGVSGRSLAVHGIHHVINICELIEQGCLTDYEFIEAQSCPAGCVGGCLTVENPFVAETNLRHTALAYPRGQGHRPKVAGEVLLLTRPITPRKIWQLDDDTTRAMEKLLLLQETEKELPGLDCGSCGSPSCRTLAEDVVRGRASINDCIFNLRERVRRLAEEMVDLAGKVPPAMAGGEGEAIDFE